MNNKVVHFNLFRPDRSIFKGSKNDKAEIQIITCSNSDKCNLFSRGECACMYNTIGFSSCIYGEKNVHYGYTKRARKYYTWCEEQMKKYHGIKYLNSPSMMGIVGDYIFLPYAHIEMIKDFPLEKKRFVKIKYFTKENIIKLIDFKPRDWFSYEIKSYQEKIPKFLKHLSEQFPELFSQIISNKKYEEKYKKFTNVGRKAILQTLKPNIGFYIDIHGSKWVWDGKQLHSKNSKMSFGLCKFTEITMVPQEKQVVKISSDDQVDIDTIFCE